MEVQHDNSQEQGYREEKLLGVRVFIPNKVPTELFEQSTEEFILYVNKKYFNSPGARTSGYSALPTLTYKEASEIMEKYRKNYPNVDAETLNEKDLAKIHKDFPDINTPKDVFDNKEVIYLYYSTLLKNDYLPSIIEAKKRKKGGRPAELSPGDMNDLEEDIVIAGGANGANYLLAANWANNQASYAGAGVVADDKWDAFRHAIWNCKIIRNCVGNGEAEWRAVSFAREACSAHEYNDAGTAPQYGFSEAMDLHNNLVGRSWMRKNTEWGIFGARKMPSDNDIINRFKSVAENQTDNVDTIEQITNRYPDGWTALYGAQWYDSLDSGAPCVKIN